MAKSAIPPALPAEPPRGLTPEERKRCRDLLDGSYDEQRHCYLDGESDKSLADKAQVPAASFAALREAAYGPLTANPELEALRDQMASFESRWADAHASFQREFATIRDRLAKAERG